MIAFCSRGGLGNQLFQYATARRLALRLGVELAADTSWHDRRLPHTTHRPFELSRLRVALRTLPPRERRWARVAGHPILGRLPLGNPWTVLRERSMAYDPGVLRCADRTLLHGYFQSPRYFEEVRDTLLSELEPVDPPSPEDLSLLASMATSESVSVHVRRGDYVTLSAAAAYHGTCSPGYYRAAFELVASKVEDPVVFVFSDDPAWARANLRFPAPTHYVDHNPPEAAPQDLRLLAGCRHAIIANSSFSWWGAWLGKQQGKLVVAPRRWFADGRPTPDLLPAGWTPI